MTALGKILIAEDDPSLALGLIDTLTFEGFEVLHATEGQRAIELAAEASPQCIILDLMLPDINGYQVCEAIRRTDPHTPILMLTARSQEADKIRGLDAGADDYVTKPFSIGELVARIRALFRRVARGNAKSQPFPVGEATVDPAAQTLTTSSGSQPLSFYEVELLKLLHERAGEPVSREELLEKIWGIEASPTNRSVDNFIVKLRKKIEDLPDKPRFIVTVYGVGYRLVPTEG